MIKYKHICKKSNMFSLSYAINVTFVINQVSFCISWLSYVCLILCPQIQRNLHAFVSWVLAFCEFEDIGSNRPPLAAKNYF